MNEPTNVFITVKTYPALSTKYDELVCTAGITDKGKWVRLYPVPFRKLDLENKYAKYQWLSILLVRNDSDFRPETFRVVAPSSITLGLAVRDWNERRRILFDNTPVYTDMNELIKKAKSNELSLAIFKPQQIIDFVVEPTEREWSKEKLELLEVKSKQLSLFQTVAEVKREFSVVKKLPYKFSYQFCDSTGKERTLMIEDWELGALFWKYDDEITAIEKVKQKYCDKLLKRDVYFFLGTTKEHHYVSKNPFIIIGVFYPPIQNQRVLFED